MSTSTFCQRVKPHVVTTGKRYKLDQNQRVDMAEERSAARKQALQRIL